MNTDTLDFSDYDEQSQIEMQKLSFLKADDLKKEALSSNPLDKIRITKSAREISNEIALETPRGKKSALYKSIYITKNIDFVKISDFLKLDSDFDYNYEKFMGKETFIFSAPLPLNFFIPVKYNSENPLIQNTFSGEKELELKGKLYNEVGVVNSNVDFDGDITGGYEFKFDYNKREIEYLVHYYFVGKKRVYEKDNKDNIAFTISSTSFDDFYTFVKISRRELRKEYLETISAEFINAIKQVNSEEDMIPIQKNYDERLTLNTKKLDGLDWLYQNIPDFVAAKLDFDQTIQNVFKLSSYDKGSLTDTTKSITSVLSRLDAQKVYSYFLSNPQKLINLLSGFSNDELVENFCQYLTTLTLKYIKPDENKARRFNQGENTHIETNILFGDKEGKVELKNEFQLPMIGFKSANLINLFSKDIEINNPNNKSNQFHPLELIYLTHYDENLKETIEIPTIALYAKYLGDKSEWSDVLDATLAVIDIISIVFSGVAISSGAKGVARLFAVADITVGTINLALLSPDLRNKLNKTEAGRWFVNHWGLISFCMSAGTISYYLAKGIVKYHKQVQQQLKDEADLSKQIDELVEESKKVVGDNISGNGLYNGRILSKADLDVWAKKLLKEYGTLLQKVDKFDNPSILAQFDPNTNTILYKDDVTEYFMLHESFHAEEFKKIGFDKYVKDAPLRGVKESDYTTENWIRLYKREKYVYDRIVEKAKKYKLNSEEVSTPPFGHAFQYFDTQIVLELEIRNIPIPKN